jgi:UDP-3-O-[3-hydroxymyristoyl] N-acetylglucosamine deacetylase
MTATQAPIVIVDDEPAICQTLEGILADDGFQVISCLEAESFFEVVQHTKPALVLLDIWLPGIDGMNVLAQIRRHYPDITVIMMSGHTGIAAAVKAIKMGAHDFIEKPLNIDILLEKVTAALDRTPQSESRRHPAEMRPTITDMPVEAYKGAAASLVETRQPQRTLKRDVVLRGTGLMSGRNTGLILSPLDEDQGIVFQSLDGMPIPAHVRSLECFSTATDKRNFTANSTTLTANNHCIRTVEHLMAVLHMAGLSNVLIKSDDEVPNIDGSAIDYWRLILKAGIIAQAANTRAIAVHRKIAVGTQHPSEKYLYIEPFDGFEVTMRVNFPAPILEQSFTFNPTQHAFEREIAPARSFNTFENIGLAQKMGKVGSGYLDSHIIIYEGKVINTELRFPDEFVRHKILDLIGDLYLLGHPIRGRLYANMTSHQHNQTLIQNIYCQLNGNTA